MSNRRKKRALEIQNERTEQILRAKVRLDGVGEDPAIAAFLTQMPKASQSQAVELALALDRYLRGDLSVLDNPKYAAHIEKMREKAVEIEDAERRWAEDPVKFADETFSMAERIKMTGDRKARMEAKASAMYAEERAKAVAGQMSQQLQLDMAIQTGPKEDVSCPGVIETYLENGVPVPRIIPVIVRILHRTWVLRPGLNHNVPSIFATRYRQMTKTDDDRMAREQALSEGLRARDLEAAQDKISAQSGIRRATVPQVAASDRGR